MADTFLFQILCHCGGPQAAGRRGARRPARRGGGGLRRAGDGVDAAQELSAARPQATMTTNAFGLLPAPAFSSFGDAGGSRFQPVVRILVRRGVATGFDRRSPRARNTDYQSLPGPGPLPGPSALPPYPTPLHPTSPSPLINLVFFLGFFVFGYSGRP